MTRKLVIADTSVWIGYQRDPSSPAGQELDALLATREVVMVGPVLAEILQGARSDEEFDFLAENLDALKFVDADKDTWVRVGQMGLALRRDGATLAHADLIIASLAMQHGLPLFTLDQDFGRIPGLHLYSTEMLDSA